MNASKKHLSLFVTILLPSFLRSMALSTVGKYCSFTLKSFDELKNAIDSGTVNTKEAGIVVNMPFLTWPGGTR